MTVAGTGGVTGGTVQVTALAGAITQAMGDTVATDEGNISFTAATSVQVGVLDARLNADRLVPNTSHQSAWGSVSVVATSGAIANAQNPAVQTAVYASSARFESATGIGLLGVAASANPIVTEVATIAARTDSVVAGNISLCNISEEPLRPVVGGVGGGTIGQSGVGTGGIRLLLDHCRRRRSRGSRPPSVRRDRLSWRRPWARSR